MNNTNTPIDVYLEVGKKKTFAGSIDWPGWCRWGRDEASALQDLLHYGSRYALVLEKTGLEFNPPRNVSEFDVVERLTGNKTTDFGAPDIAPSSDSRPMDKDGLQRFEIILKACWEEFDSSIKAASGKELRKGPRGGGRDLDGVIRHVMGAEAGYLSRLAHKHKVDEGGNLSEELDKLRNAILNTLAAAQRGELPGRGPRGGVIWKPRYFVRRVAWHVLDHAWELEDRILDHS
jgi:hypothetical protein